LEQIIQYGIKYDLYLNSVLDYQQRKTAKTCLAKPAMKLLEGYWR